MSKNIFTYTTHTRYNKSYFPSIFIVCVLCSCPNRTRFVEKQSSWMGNRVRVCKNIINTSLPSPKVKRRKYTRGKVLANDNWKELNYRSDDVRPMQNCLFLCVYEHFLMLVVDYNVNIRNCWQATTNSHNTDNSIRPMRRLNNSTHKCYYTMISRSYRNIQIKIVGWSKTKMHTHMRTNSRVNNIGNLFFAQTQLSKRRTKKYDRTELSCAKRHMNMIK